jgi:hypothetical protein
VHPSAWLLRIARILVIVARWLMLLCSQVAVCCTGSSLLVIEPSTICYEGLSASAIGIVTLAGLCVRGLRYPATRI